MIVVRVVYLALWLFMLFLIGRIVFDLIQSFARGWRPTGPVLVVAELIFTVTDPPLKFFRSLLPMARVGSFSFDLGFLALFFLTSITVQLLGGYLADAR